MDPILDKARAAQNLLERLATKIPGFKGYKERELRRDADALQRDHLAKSLLANLKLLDGAAAGATRGGDMEVINEIETVRKRVDRIAARIRHADRGYSGFFDPIKIDEAVLGRAYQLDLDLASGVESVAGEASRLSTALRPALTGMLAAVDALDQRMTERESILRAIK